ncbi:hypothetical protein LINPERPRIM_LOCUS9520 [Linum perenne]
MQLACNSNIQNFVIQTDSKCTTQILSGRLPNHDHQHSSLVLRFQEMLNWNWEVQLQHIYYESNFLADTLASKWNLLPLGLQWLAYDRLRLSQPWLILCYIIFYFLAHLFWEFLM